MPRGSYYSRVELRRRAQGSHTLRRSSRSQGTRGNVRLGIAQPLRDGPANGWGRERRNSLGLRPALLRRNIPANRRSYSGTGEADHRRAGPPVSGGGRVDPGCAGPGCGDREGHAGETGEWRTAPQVQDPESCRRRPGCGRPGFAGPAGVFGPTGSRVSYLTPKFPKSRHAREYPAWAQP